MKVLVDTSVWGDFFNGYNSSCARALSVYIEGDIELATCGLVIAEFFQGLTDARSVRKLQPFFLDLDYLTPFDPDTYLRAASLYRGLRKQGVTVRSMVDCLLAQLACDRGCAILTKDRDFERIASSGLLDLELAPLTPPIT
jgi:predicted nucleic acid-binding protein